MFVIDSILGFAICYTVAVLDQHSAELPMDLAVRSGSEGSPRGEQQSRDVTLDSTTSSKAKQQAMNRMGRACDNCRRRKVSSYPASAPYRAAFDKKRADMCAGPRTSLLFFFGIRSDRSDATL